MSDAVREALSTTFDALDALKRAVQASGKMEGREYIHLAIQVNSALDKAKAALSERQTVLIYVPDGYATVVAFLDDCGFQRVEPAA